MEAACESRAPTASGVWCVIRWTANTDVGCFACCSQENVNSYVCFNCYFPILKAHMKGGDKKIKANKTKGQDVVNIIYMCTAFEVQAQYVIWGISFVNRKKYNGSAC